MIARLKKLFKREPAMSADEVRWLQALLAAHRRVVWEPTVPSRGTTQSAGLDLCARGDCIVGANPVRISLGTRVVIPPGHFGLLLPRSSLHKRQLVGLVGVIDSDYRGDIQAVVFSTSGDFELVKSGDRIYQIIILPLSDLQHVAGAVTVDTERGSSGFGSTGV